LTHREIEKRGWVEAYVERRLSATDAADFEEHYFRCEQCFSDVQAMEKFIAGLKYAGLRGLLDPKPARVAWFLPAFVFAAALSLVLGAGLAFVGLVRLPAREAQLKEALAAGKASRARIAELDQRADADMRPEANVPVVILEASRGNDPPNRLVVGGQTRTALLWLDVPSQRPWTRFRLTISTLDNREFKAIPSLTLHRLERNQNGALAVSLPAAQLATGSYLVRLFLDDEPGAPVIEEYRLAVVHN
jgi:hypothetical protein